MNEKLNIKTNLENLKKYNFPFHILRNLKKLPNYILSLSF